MGYRVARAYWIDDVLPRRGYHLLINDSCRCKMLPLNCAEHRPIALSGRYLCPRCSVNALPAAGPTHTRFVVSSCQDRTGAFGVGTG